jgi:hypothetical protein
MLPVEPPGAGGPGGGEVEQFTRVGNGGQEKIRFGAIPRGGCRRGMR